MRADQLTDAVSFHAEGPVWHEAWGGLQWVDMLAGDVLALADNGQISRRHVGDVAAAIRPRQQGGAVLALERGFALEDADGMLTELSPVWADAGVRFNDGGCDPHGRFLCGSMAYDARPGGGSLYCLAADGTVITVLESVAISNGIEWSPIGDLAYYVDSATGRIDVFDDDPLLGLVNRRPFAEIPAEAGLPDGVTVDAEGGVWVALYGGGAVRRYGSAGELDAVVEVSTNWPTACTFGGEGLATLFVTTSKQEREASDDTAAGALFRCKPGVSGLPVKAFAG
jgi:sugar lactone lactonase YvrE